MKKPLLLFCIFICLFFKTNNATAQTIKNNTTKDFKEYTSKDGFEVFNVSSMLFDDIGWLWIAGTNLNANNTLFNYKPIIQRYDGQSFYTLELPNLENAINSTVELIKRQDEQLYVKYASTNGVKLFLINPENLVFKEIDVPPNISNLFLFPYKNHTLVYVRAGIDTRLYELTTETLQFKELPYKPVTKATANEIPYYSNFIPFDDHFIVNDDREGVYSYHADGSVDRPITYQSLGISITPNDVQLKIITWFRKDGKTYVLFNNTNAYYLYNPKQKTWTKTDVFKTPFFEKEFLSNTEKVFTDHLGNFLKQKINQKVQVNTFYFNESLPTKSIEIPSLSGSEIASRDFKKELYVEYEGTFRHYTFQNEKNTTFLADKSIRGLLQINEEEVLVATENSGWFAINLNTKEERSFALTLNGKPYLGTGNRDIFDAKDFYWSNDSNGIIKVDKKNQAVTSYIYYPIADMVMDERYIYYGTTIQNLMKFDKQQEVNINIRATTKYDVQGILKINEVIYLATTAGLLIYENNQLQLYKTDTSSADDSYFIAIAHHEKYGVLLGSRSGKLYQFNSKEKSFQLLYEDELNASIATILFDEAENIWMNTFNGIVSFNPTTKDWNRYTMTDGLSFYEANRYSALKTTNGHFLVGTLKGLNYFHPKEIAKTTIDAELRLSSLTYVDEHTAQEVTEMAPKQLNNLKTINLSAANKNLFLKFGLIGMYDSDKITYRYRLNQQPWMDLNNANELRLFSLASGAYTLDIEAIDSAKSTIGIPISLSINADEFFYKTPWFYVLLVLALLTVGFWYYTEQRKKFQLKAQFAHQIINSQEQERSRIAKDLHDSVGQRLLILKNTLETNTKDADEIRLVEETIKEVRTMSHNLHPFQFEQLGLVQSLKNMMDAFQKSSEVFYSYEIEDISGRISKEKELFLFRMLQECITNVEKHAQATACKLTVSHKNDMVTFQLKDNGKGFSVEKAQQSKTSLGMQSLKERAQYINAIFEIQSLEGKGTTITIKMNS